MVEMVTFCLAYWWSEIVTIISFYVLFGIVFKILFPDPLHPMFELQLSRREDKCLAFLRWTTERLQVRKLKRQQETLKSMLHMYTYRGVFFKSTGQCYRKTENIYVCKFNCWQ